MRTIPAKTLLTALILLSLTVEGWGAGMGSLAVTTTVLSKSNCRFTAPGTATLAFGNLDPTNPVPVPASTTLAFTCNGSAPLATYLILGGNGLHFSDGQRRLQNSSNLANYLPYTLTLTPQTATVPKSSSQTLTVNGLINGADYRYATAGAYTDQVILSINP